MICENCKGKDECGWYASYKRIENEIYLGVGTDNTLGRALLAAMSDNQLEQCEYFEDYIDEMADDLKRGEENDNAKNKVTSLEIIVRMIDNKPYYEIKYKKVGEDYYHVGYSSYNLDNVLKWRDECFELVDAKVTNADRIRNMSDEELASVLFSGCIDSMDLEE